jgi:hypothetical protein
MSTIVLLDFDNQGVYIYDNFDEKALSVEEYIELKGHVANNCQWMITTRPLKIFNNGFGSSYF